jgi:hypothetical protein
MSKEYQELHMVIAALIQKVDELSHENAELKNPNTATTGQKKNGLGKKEEKAIRGRSSGFELHIPVRKRFAQVFDIPRIKVHVKHRCTKNNACGHEKRASKLWQQYRKFDRLTPGIYPV